MSARSRLVAAAALAVGGAVLVAVALRPSPRTAGTQLAGYAGSAACSSCHAAEFAAWQDSAHRWAMMPATADAPLRAPHADPLLARGDGLALAGAALGRSRDLPLAYALGRRRVEQYLAPLVPNRLQALPLAFDVVRGEWFDLFADDERQPSDWGHWTNRGMNANAQCLFCHTTGYEKGYRAATDDYATRWVEMGVGCEACHGPGAAHAAARARGDAADPYAGRDPERLFDACAACHTRRVERADFTPGDAFLDAFEPDLPDLDAYWADGQVREELYEGVSFQMSRMYAEGVRCWNCHAVHAGGTQREGNPLCLGCHAPAYDTPAHTRHAAGSDGARCASCHMPVTVYMQRDPRHDHSFARPDPETTLALGVPSACDRCHAAEGSAWAAERVREWYPDGAPVRVRRREVAGALAGGRRGDPAAVPVLLELVRGDGDAVRRAAAARLLARFATAEDVTPALLAALTDAEPLVRAGSAWALGQRDALAPGVGTALTGALGDPVRVVRLHAALGLRGAALEPPASAALDAATAEWRRSQEQVADTPEAHYNLAILAAARGDVEGAVREYREALRLWPASIQARHNLGMVLAQAGRRAEAEREFRTVLEREVVPDTAFALGLLLAEQERWADAAAALERCLGADPSYPRARYNLGLAYGRAGDATRALAALERAAGEPQTHAEAVRAIQPLVQATGDRERIARWALEAAKLDPAVAEDPRLRTLLAR